MANEAVKVELTNEDGFPRRYAVASGVFIAKGSVLKIVDARTASAAITAGVPVAGIAKDDKSASDFSTSISVWTDGIFEMSASGNITKGDGVITSDANFVMGEGSQAIIASGAILLGYALEDALDAERINVRVHL